MSTLELEQSIPVQKKFNTSVKLPALEDMIESTARDLHVSSADKQKTYRLLEHLASFDEETARDGMQCLPMALTAIRAVGEFYDKDTFQEEQYAWSASILHDIGKAALPKELIEKSHLGQEWTQDDREKMKLHVTVGGAMVRNYGFSQEVIRVIETHHGRQLGDTYGVELDNLTEVQKNVRNAVAIADFADAMQNRNNTRNAHLSHEQRLEIIHSDAELVYGDYPDGRELGRYVVQSLLEK